jgi:eukaryotic-like serine/threonine-protein kinase
MSVGVIKAPVLQDLAAGDVLGRYELLLPVAQGGMATVWAARMTGAHDLAKIVAIKTMLPTLSCDPRFEKMFLSEAELAARIKHPNVCEILDLGEENGVLYLAMEWIEGESLVTLLGDCERAGRRVPFAAAAGIGAAAARGLHAAHELKDESGELVGVVHRDVSPHNILVTYGGVVKIVDFGVAKAVARSDHQPTHAGHLKGKVLFMAPEQAFCDEVDRRTDVFALGIVLYQLTTGSHPFRADNELATLARITSPEPVPAPVTLVPDYPPELAAVVMKALAKERDQRFDSMRDLADALEIVAAKLAERDGAQGLEAFVLEALAARREARSIQLAEARRAADERGELRALGGLASPIPDLADAAGPASSDAAASSLREPQRRGGLARAAALVSLGAILGALALIWATRGAAPPISASAAATSLSSESAPAAAAIVPASAAPSASASAPAVDAAASAQAPAPASPSAKAARPVVKVPRPDPTSEPNSKFRSPGF